MDSAIRLTSSPNTVGGQMDSAIRLTSSPNTVGGQGYHITMLSRTYIYLVEAWE